LHALLSPHLRRSIEAECTLNRGGAFAKRFRHVAYEAAVTRPAEAVDGVPPRWGGEGQSGAQVMMIDEAHGGYTLKDFRLHADRAWQRARSHPLGRHLPAACPLTLCEICVLRMYTWGLDTVWNDGAGWRARIRGLASAAQLPWQVAAGCDGCWLPRHGGCWLLRDADGWLLAIKGRRLMARMAMIAAGC
jgi:hypothetical protein